MFNLDTQCPKCWNNAVDPTPPSERKRIRWEDRVLLPNIASCENCGIGIQLIFAPDWTEENKKFAFGFRHEQDAALYGGGLASAAYHEQEDADAYQENKNVCHFSFTPMVRVYYSFTPITERKARKAIYEIIHDMNTVRFQGSSGDGSTNSGHFFVPESEVPKLRAALIEKGLIEVGAEEPYSAK